MVKPKLMQSKYTSGAEPDRKILREASIIPVIGLQLINCSVVPLTMLKGKITGEKYMSN